MDVLIIVLQRKQTHIAYILTVTLLLLLINPWMNINILSKFYNTSDTLIGSNCSQVAFEVTA